MSGKLRLWWYGGLAGAALYTLLVVTDIAFGFDSELIYPLIEPLQEAWRLSGLPGELELAGPSVLVLLAYAPPLGFVVGAAVGVVVRWILVMIECFRLLAPNRE